MDMKRLQQVLRVFSVAPMTAVLAAMLPVSAMDAVHRSLGLGSLPKGAIVEYLARSTSLFYALHGALLWYVASDLGRYRDFFIFYLRLSLVFAVGLFLADLTSGLPTQWTMAEGPAVAAFVGLTMWMFRKAEARDDA